MIPRWLSWMFVLVLFYMIYAAAGTHRAAEEIKPEGAVPTIDEKHYPELAKTTDVEAWKRRLDPHYAAVMDCDKPEAGAGTLAMRVVQDEPGSGEGAKCGDTVTVELTFWGTDGRKKYSGSAMLDLGSHQLASGLDYALLGSKPGAVRTVTLPPAAQARAKTTKLAPELLKALPTGPAAQVAILTAKRVK